MNNECLVTTLRGTAKGSNLRKLNELIFDMVPRPNATPAMGNGAKMSFSVAEPVTLTLEGAYVTDEKGTNKGTTLSVNTGNVSFFLVIESENAKIKIDNKFNLTGLGFPNNSFWVAYNGITCKYIPSIDAKEFKYIKLNRIAGAFMLVGNVADINTESLTYISFANPYMVTDTRAENLPQKLTGDGSSLLPKLTDLSFSFTTVYFDITKLNPGVSYIAQWEADMRGDISDLSFPNVTNITFGANSYLTPMLLTGKVDNITRTNENQHVLVFRATPNITGNVGALGKLCYGFAAHPDARFTYSNTVKKSYVMALNGVYLESGLDDYLNDTAKLDMNPSVKSGLLSATWKSIYVSGTRTSASDEAIKTIKQKGFAITVNGENLNS